MRPVNYSTNPSHAPASICGAIRLGSADVIPSDLAGSRSGKGKKVVRKTLVHQARFTMRGSFARRLIPSAFSIRVHPT